MAVFFIYAMRRVDCRPCGVTVEAYGFRTYDHAEIALYHALGNLPEPDWLTHRFA